jgi:hypothetical protein
MLRAPPALHRNRPNGPLRNSAAPPQAVPPPSNNKGPRQPVLQPLPNNTPRRDLLQPQRDLLQQEKNGNSRRLTDRPLFLLRATRQ